MYEKLHTYGFKIRLSILGAQAIGANERRQIHHRARLICQNYPELSIVRLPTAHILHLLKLSQIITILGMRFFY